ncbi:DUF6383 domain-containing protein [uncultured Parabacteroides sp.]|uniref:DUF6383 domain-containing protein n=1 Tax=uncultured Parabacteroides sp. TaxID=512312 RepID=UPI00261ADC99|nr:DUF6383 domain-containing protein [uncultured Parabacteroides sp.]
MNKKFSTLLAGAALLSAMSANAAGIKLTEGENSGLYQLKAGSSYLSITETSTGVDEIKMVSHNSANLGGTMWCVKVDSENQGQNPKYDFTNKIGKFLGLDINTIAGKAAAELEVKDAKVGGDLSGWKFSPVFKNGVEKSVLYSYFTTDSVIGLQVDGAGDVKMIKVEATDAKIASANFTEFELVEANPIVIAGADELNSIFGTQDKKAGIALKFTPGVIGDGAVNPFVEKKFTVEASGTTNYFHVLRSDSSYLYVDTAYTNAVGGAKFLAYNWSNLKDTYKTGSKTYATAKDSINSLALKDQYKFKFTYHPSNDSLEIQVKSVTLKEDASGNEVKYWNDANAVTKTDMHISLQELLKDKVRILTVDKDQNTKIELGFAGCKAMPTNKTTVADGVYLIRNAKTGKYLASPIHNNGANTEWVTLDLQDATHMPAYQWVVLKKNLTDKNNISPIEATNREFATLNIASLQLNKLPGASYMYASAAASLITTSDSLEFIPVAKEIYTNKYVGYKHLTNEELITNKYTFNYWHPYASDKFIGVKDSTMNVLEGKKAFTLKSSYKEHAYGYAPSEEVAGNPDKKITGRIPGLVQPVRTMYIITDGDKTFRNHTRAVEDKYILSKHYPNTQADSVYFKENNHIEGTHYYAIVEASATGLITAGAEKAGVSDYDATASLKAQVLSETRTSAFAIAPDETPLYRQFNNALLGENVDNSADSLMFKETIRNEYLMDEHNGNLLNNSVDYAGIWSEGKADGKLAFRLDTAWLTRGAGKVKPQYLVSAHRELIEGEKIIPCTESGKHITADGQVTDDPYQCVHAVHVKTPAFIYGKYLVNFSDSAAAVAARKEALNPYLFNTKAVSNSSYTRVGFVPAVQYGDTLIVLTGKYKAMTAEQLKNEGIESIMAVYKKDYPKFINILTGDKHKNVTWSFRYVNPDKAAQAYVDGEEGENNSFLIESNVYGAKDNAYQTINGDLAKAIAPKAGAAWLKMHNGCLVLTDASSSFDAAKTGGDGALVFNAGQKTTADDMVTSTDNIDNVEGVSVVTGIGTVTVQGAAGKSVVITNILGKVIAETVITSDNATINVPAGIVAVAVEGEEAVKAIVK